MALSPASVTSRAHRSPSTIRRLAVVTHPVCLRPAVSTPRRSAGTLGGLSYQTLRDSAFNLTSGSVKNASRQTQGEQALLTFSGSRFTAG